MILKFLNGIFVRRSFFKHAEKIYMSTGSEYFSDLKYKDLKRNFTSSDTSLEMPSESDEVFMSLRNPFISDVENMIRKDSLETSETIEQMLRYNLPVVKTFKSAILMQTYKTLAQNEVSKLKLKSVYMLGWCVEMGVAAINILDDVADQPELRNGTPCWHTLSGVGLAAVNHAYFSLLILPRMVKMYVPEKGDLICQHVQNVINHSLVGQILDENWKIKHIKDIDKVSIDVYMPIIYHKITVALREIIYSAKTLANGYENDTQISIDDQIIRNIGLLYQIRNDYMDCFGDPRKTGTKGVDIQAGALTWLFITALNKCSEEQRQVLMRNYGRSSEENVQAIKNLYNDLNLQEEYFNIRDNTLETLLLQLESIENIYLRDAFEYIAKAMVEAT